MVILLLVLPTLLVSLWRSMYSGSFFFQLAKRKEKREEAQKELEKAEEAGMKNLIIQGKKKGWYLFYQKKITFKLS